MSLYLFNTEGFCIFYISVGGFVAPTVTEMSKGGNDILNHI